MLQRPVRWEGNAPDDDQRLAIIDQISNAVTQQLFDLTTRRLKDDVQNAWLEAYAQRGTGSTFVRAGIIADKVYGRGAPIPTVGRPGIRTASWPMSQHLSPVSRMNST